MTTDPPPIKGKWDSIYSGSEDTLVQAADVLVANQHLLPAKGSALDLACGLGANALFLARAGLNTTGWDISDVAVETLLKRAQGLPLTAKAVDLNQEKPQPAAFDVICVAHYLDRNLFPAIIEALRPAGLLFYQTFISDKTNPGSGPNCADFLLKDNELLTLCTGLRVLHYRDEGCVGDQKRGFRNKAMIVAQKH